MSTFSGLGTAASALAAARRGMDLAGQNIANQLTPGYTRQRLETTALAAPAGATRFGPVAGQGVSVDAIGRLGDAVLDARVRDTLAASGYWSTRASAATAAEAALAEPTKNGLSDQLSQLWTAWQDLSNAPDSTAAAAAVITRGETLAARISDGYRSVVEQWSAARDTADRTVEQINAAAAQIADLNASIREVTATGASANELVDRRNLLAQTVSRLSGAVGTTEPDGTLTLRLDGNALVSGSQVRELEVAGPRSLDAGEPVTVAWRTPGGPPVGISSGELAGTLSVLAPAEAGGVLAGLAASYNDVAASLAASVNAQHRAGVTASGGAGGDFFALSADTPAALGLSVVPSGRDQLAVAAPGGGELDGGNADALSGIGKRTDSPDALWSDVVSRLAVATAAESGRAARAETTAVAAVAAQQSVAGVDNDEETLSLLTYQTAYQAAARVLTAVDEALDILINRTGLVGR
ncbi:flagellar hook-associated protein FlgK [Microbacterium sp. cf332]|uniref:flagellar hook-associated protein FlgK n=1 Tax=Microbacterium sp. cf332 TaxID=1761804 RepID=UPI00087E9B6B|nr:flagellar hook-associated protein FlgK [Microbacterium sp. cf332]SDQ50204.1 flagellar hook-associated protein 1 FlgK [Microbacterium sp. cf332]